MFNHVERKCALSNVQLFTEDFLQITLFFTIWLYSRVHSQGEVVWLRDGDRTLGRLERKREKETE